MDSWNIFKKNRKGALISLTIIEKKALLIVISLSFLGEGGIALRNRWGGDRGVLNSHLNRNYLECTMLANVQQFIVAFIYTS